VTGRQGRRCKQLLDDLTETVGHWKLKDEALDRTLWRTRFRESKGLDARQTTSKEETNTLRIFEGKFARKEGKKKETGE
jgi:hypothetical protein